MTTLTQKFDRTQLNANVPNIRPGDIVKVHQKIKEGDPSNGSGQVKERVQIFEGVVIARKHGKGISGTITVRKVVEGVGVERIFPVYSPSLLKIDVIKSSKVRRAKLYYLRTAKGVKGKLKNKDLAVAIAPEEKPVVETLENTSIAEPAPEIK